ncbi:MAG: hypothetical protein IPG00_20705 [Saprospiraceae bacterium]|nr:hypothetical protein [Saprospiraceae bacterium]
MEYLIYALTQYAESSGIQFNRWQIEPVLDLIIPSTQKQRLSVELMVNKFPDCKYSRWMEITAATGSNYDNLRVSMIWMHRSWLTGTYTNIPVTAGAPQLLLPLIC